MRITSVLIATTFCLGAIAALGGLRPAVAEWSRATPGARIEHRSFRLTTAKNTGHIIRPGIRFNMVGLEWTGTVVGLELRARGADGRWSRWIAVQSQEDDGPDLVSKESRVRRTRNAPVNFLTVPVWVGDAKSVQVRALGVNKVVRGRLSFINSTGTSTLTDRAATRLRRSAATVLGPASLDASAAPNFPTVTTRKQWGADERIRRAEPAYASSLNASIIHHTVSSNSYGPNDGAALVRGIYSYHVRSLGWNDIGYNALVDKYGVVYEGRHGGLDRNVIGAHVTGFNTGTFGISLIGDYRSTIPSTEQLSAVTRMVSWRMDLAHRDPRGTATLTSRGGDKHPAGRVVSTRAVGGHRDLGATTCPGDRAYALINQIALNAWNDSGPKFVDPMAIVNRQASGDLKSIDFTATASEPLTWKVTLIRSSSGAEVESFTRGPSQTLTTSWKPSGMSLQIPATDLRWSVQATSNSGAVATPHEAALVATQTSAQLEVVREVSNFLTPNGDGLADLWKPQVSVSERAPVRAEVWSSDRSTLVATLWSGRSVGPGPINFSWAGTAKGQPIQDGIYGIRLSVDASSSAAAPSQLWFDVEINRGIALRVKTKVISPNSDGRMDGVVVRAEPVSYQSLRLLESRSKRVISPLSNGRWDGRDGAGRVVGDGVYFVQLIAPGARGVITLNQPVRIDTRPPTFRRRVSAGRRQIRTSEPVTVISRRGSKSLQRKAPRARWVTVAKSGRVLIQDEAGNRRTIWRR